MKEFVQVKEGQQFAGGILTETGASEINAGRIRVAAGKKESVFLRLAHRIEALHKPQLNSVVQKLIVVNNEIFP